jgi:methylenetetrahydrofolate dehydrogenase (NADP+)/methenyltetrahydrofolate cyclohydrolase/formyltetrahydrofolate synthetase
MSNTAQYVAIDACAPTSDTFAFVKRQKRGEEVHFILHFGQEPVHARLAPADRHLLPVTPEPKNTHFVWATSMRTGRPHQDAWELNLKKGEKVKVLQDMGREWFVVEGRKGVKGWVHGSGWTSATVRSTRIQRLHTSSSATRFRECWCPVNCASSPQSQST